MNNIPDGEFFVDNTHVIMSSIDLTRDHRGCQLIWPIRIEWLRWGLELAYDPNALIERSIIDSRKDSGNNMVKYELYDHTRNIGGTIKQYGIFVKRMESKTVRHSIGHGIHTLTVNYSDIERRSILRYKDYGQSRVELTITTLFDPSLGVEYWTDVFDREYQVMMFGPMPYTSFEQQFKNYLSSIDRTTMIKDLDDGTLVYAYSHNSLTGKVAGDRRAIPNNMTMKCVSEFSMYNRPVSYIEVKTNHITGDIETISRAMYIRNPIEQYLPTQVCRPGGSWVTSISDLRHRMFTSFKEIGLQPDSEDKRDQVKSPFQPATQEQEVLDRYTNLDVPVNIGYPHSRNRTVNSRVNMIQVSSTDYNVSSSSSLQASPEYVEVIAYPEDLRFKSARAVNINPYSKYKIVAVGEYTAMRVA
ncbi:hypothetical protein HDU86_000904, partial [Geranomyces michiganensis]